MTGKQHARLLGLFFWLFTGLSIALILGIAIIYVSIFGFVLTQVPQKASDPDPAVIVSIMIVVFGLILAFTVLFSVPKIIAGYGLRKEKPWARIWAIIACVMACMSFPLGTAMGVYGLVFLFGDEGKRYFDEIERRQLTMAAPVGIEAPAPNSWQ